MNRDNIKVWDMFVRLFHWSFAVVIVLAWFTHEGRNARVWHEWLGYTALALVALRIVWGLVGTKYARFSEFVHHPVHYLHYLGDMIQGKERRYLGHNPLGGLMVVALIVTAIVAGVTGFYMTQRGLTLFGIGRRSMEHVHSIAADLFVILVPVHILGVIWESVRHRENLVTAMISGNKRAN